MLNENNTPFDESGKLKPRGTVMCNCIALGVKCTHKVDTRTVIEKNDIYCNMLHDAHETIDCLHNRIIMCESRDVYMLPKIAKLEKLCNEIIDVIGIVDIPSNNRAEIDKQLVALQKINAMQNRPTDIDFHE